MSAESMHRAYQKIQERRDSTELTAQQRRMEIAAKVPGARHLLSSVSQTGKRIAQIMLSGGNDVRQRMEAAAQENLDTQARIKAMLLENGFAPDYLETPYICKSCNDSGYVGGKRCTCLTELAARYAANDFNAVAHVEPQSFSSFQMKYYDATPQSGSRSPREIMGSVFSSCQAYAEQFTAHSSSILMMGETGLGKTHLSLAIASRVMERGFSALYASAPDLFRKLQNEYYGKGEPGADTMEMLTTTQLVILDDLGAEIENQFNVSALYNIVNTRLNGNMPTIINTNLTSQELDRRYGSRIASRLMTIYKCFHFVGRDIRQQKLRNNEL